MGGGLSAAQQQQTTRQASFSVPLSFIIFRLFEFIITSAYLLQNNNWNFAIYKVLSHMASHLILTTTYWYIMHIFQK